MSTHVVLRRAAAHDVTEAHAWYENQQAGLGSDFLDCVSETLDRIAARPLGYPIVWRDARRALVRRFPYSVYYRIRGNDIRVVCVAHQSRSPTVWQQRLDQER